LSVLMVFSILIYFIEAKVQPDAFGSIPDAMWWGIATLTTVGYGDIYPATLTGKILASLTMFLGIGMFALPAAILASAYYEEIQKKNFLVSIETITEIPLFAKLPMKKAVGTSLMIIAIKSLFGFIGDLGNVNLMFDWSLLLLFTTLSVIGIYFGIYLTRFIEGKSLKKGFGWFVLIMAFIILFKEIL